MCVSVNRVSLTEFKKIDCVAFNTVEYPMSREFFSKLKSSDALREEWIF